MSAIFGIFAFGGRALSESELERMGNTLAHRGPDGRSVHIEAPAAFGHCLLRVNREDQFEAQPLVDRAARLMLAADARIDNREALAETLGIGAARLASMPDSAVILEAYRRWGEDAAAHLIGDFTFAIWDGVARKLVLGRDHMGQRVLFYYQGADFIAFATEVKALWALADVPRAISEAAIGRALMRDLRPPPEETTFEDIRVLLGRSVLTVAADGKATSRRYWRPEADPQHVGRDELYYADAYRRILTEAVACRTRRLTRPAALCLSGGFDSAGIAALAKPPAARPDAKLIAVSSVLQEGYRGPLRDPRRWVDVCRRHMPHLDVRYFVRGEETALTGIDGAFAEADGIVDMTHHVYNGLYRLAAAAGARLVMDGIGGDVTVNRRGQDALPYLLRSGELRHFLRELRWHRRATGEKLLRTLKSVAATFLPEPIRRFRWRFRHRDAPVSRDFTVSDAFAQSMIDRGLVATENVFGYRPSFIAPTSEKSRLNRTGLGPRSGLGRMAARHGLELTRPFFDKRVVELALALPPTLLVRDGKTRHLARIALGDALPPEFSARDRRNDIIDPDAPAMVDAIRPALLDEIARLERQDDPRLAAIFDFATIRRLLTARPQHGDGEGQMFARRAVRGVLVARYVAWFKGTNR